MAYELPSLPYPYDAVASLHELGVRLRAPLRWCSSQSDSRTRCLISKRYQ